MIEQLSVKDYVLFKSCIIDFKNGMSVITGETGAGKSLLIDAIGYLSGDRIKSNVIRNGKDKAILSMVLTSNEKVNAILEENGFEVDDQVIISRTVLNNNKSTVRINQQITTLSFVRKIVNLLVDIHSQMDTYRLMDTSVQMELLDSYAKTMGLKASVNEAYVKYSNVLHELETIKSEEFSDAELEFLTAQLDEIENANVQENELDALNDQIHEATSWYKNSEDLSSCLYEIDKENGALDSLYTLYKQASKSPILNDYEESFKNLYYSLQSVDEELKNMRDTHSNDSLDLDSLQSRQYLIKKLYRKYGGSYTSLMESKKSITDKIDRIIHRQDVFDKLEKEKEESFTLYMKLANALSLKRKEVFSQLESKVMEHCKDLMLENARFMISCMEKKPSNNGIDDIEFLVSMNPGQDFSSLSASASGGELSRLMLALKVVFQASNGIETIIFDEIDTGVSGKVALAMGAKMKVLSKNYQVLCITHLASVAVYANTHYLVNKKTSASETITSVQELDQDKTIQELAVMTSGEASQKAKESMQDLWVKIHG
ncbi:DNA repair protein RecN [Holdemanella porci]|uniref:DNA repair protein RecN n=1 Tax=Holdemanella porci TaxID=2652276 RepID=UPI001C26B191|nr:DNA repair protein RecN [Holdemanella porci]MBU9870766.1 DNA repair protein RecN [Holdemanella porci]MBU9885938.1 DNA repair protein RecN [Holdemanella porci]